MSFYAYFFFHKIIPEVVNTVSADQGSISNLSLRRHRIIRVFKFLFRQLMTLETLRFIFSHLEQLMAGEKSGRLKYENLNILRIKQTFLMK